MAPCHGAKCPGKDRAELNHVSILNEKASSLLQIGYDAFSFYCPCRSLFALVCSFQPMGRAVTPLGSFEGNLRELCGQAEQIKSKQNNLTITMNP